MNCVKVFIFVACFVLLSALVDAHGRLTVPTPRDAHFGATSSTQNSPVDNNPLTNEFVCRNYAAVPSSNFISVQAGENVNVQWSFSAAHVGDCFAYLSYTPDLPDNQKVWFKIKSWARCEQTMNQNMPVTIPSYLPSCDHCILRWEWYALHVRPTIEYYAQCVDVRITNGQNPGILPTPQVTIPGHLATNGSMYRSGYDQSSPFFFVGPPDATVGGPTSYPPTYTTTSNPVSTTRTPAATTRAAQTPSTTAYQQQSGSTTGAYQFSTTGAYTCSIGAEGCSCTGGGACDPGLVCNNGMCARPCTAGTEGCPCQNGACNSGLSCSNDVCVISGSNTGGSDCQVGSERCACTAGGACDPGLDCLSQICVQTEQSLSNMLMVSAAISALALLIAF